MTNDRQAFIASLVLHLSALGLIAAIIFINPMRAEEKPVVLELVALPDDATPPPAMPTPPAPFRTPDIKPATQREFPAVDLPEPEPAAPAPEPEPVVTPDPAPIPEVPKPAPEPPKPKPVNYQDFIRQQGLPDQVQRNQPRATPKPAPRIDTSDLTKNLQNLLTVTPQPNVDAASPQIIAYQQRLVQAVELRWEKPSSGTGREWAEVSFQVSSSGIISNVKIIRSDGPEAFLASIRRAISNTPSIGPRPSGWNGAMTITFRLR